METSLSRRPRYISAGEELTRQQKLSRKAQSEFRKACVAFYGRSYGETIYEWIQRGATDWVFACEKLLGVKPLVWQASTTEALNRKHYVTAKMPNAGGKTTDYALKQMLAAFYRQWSTPEWGSKEYRVLHLAPEEAQALQAKQKIDAILAETSTEQMYPVPGGFRSRPCLLTPFFEEGKPDGIHQGFLVNDGASTITYRPTSFKAKGTDGTDPAFVTWDEVRHEKLFDYVLNAIIMARFLRVPFGRLLIEFTPLGASVELISAYNRGLSAEPGDADWMSISTEDLRSANPSVSDETIARANRNIAKRYLPMVVSGKTIQAEDAKFTQEAIDAMFYGTIEPKELSDVVTIRQRVVARCAVCKTQDGLHQNGQREHPIIGWVDPASSSGGADSIVAMAFDLHPPTYPRRWVDIPYIEELPVGTRIQRVAAHVAIMSMVIHGICGFDQNSALGYNVNDNLVDFSTRDALFKDQGEKHIERELRDRLRVIKDELAPEPDIAPIEHNKKSEKDQDLAYAVALTDMDKVSSPFHLTFKQQLTNYVRKDTGIRQDYVMTLTGGMFIAKFDLPDVSAERTRRDKGGRRITRKPGEEDLYLGTGGADPYFTIPNDATDTLGVIDAYAGDRKG